MAYSYNLYTGTGALQYLTVPAYIDRDHIKVSVNGADTTSFTWVNSNSLSITAPNGSAVRVYRRSSPGARVTNYMDGVPLTESALDNDSLQAFYLAQEQLDATDEAVTSIGSLPAALAQMANETGTSSTNAATATTKADEASASAAAALANKNSSDTNATNSANSASSAATSAGTATTKAAEAVASVDTTKDVSSGTITGDILALANRGQCIPITAGVTVPSGIFALGNTVSLYNDTAGNLTITQGSGFTLRNNGQASTGNRTLPQRAIATIWFRSATEAVITGCT